MMDERMIECAMRAWVRRRERKQFCLAAEGHLRDYVTTESKLWLSVYDRYTASSLGLFVCYTQCMHDGESLQLSSRVRL